jgi:hypothetical protein
MDMLSVAMESVLVLAMVPAGALYLPEAVFLALAHLAIAALYNRRPGRRMLLLALEADACVISYLLMRVVPNSALPVPATVAVVIAVTVLYASVLMAASYLQE